jgi:putative transposase
LKASLSRVSSSRKFATEPVRRVCCNVKYWRSPSMALRWTGAAMQEAVKGFRRLKAHKQLPLLKDALAKHKAKAVLSSEHLAHAAKAA